MPFGFDAFAVTVMVLLTLSYNIINIDLLKISYNDDHNVAIDAQVGLFIEKGILIENLMRRHSSEEFFNKEFDLNLR